MSHLRTQWATRIEAATTAGRFPCPGSNTEPMPLDPEHADDPDLRATWITPTHHMYHHADYGICSVCHEPKVLLKSGLLPKHDRYVSWADQQKMQASRENSTPTRVKARDWINNAIRDGRIKKPKHCQGRDCKATDIKAHHYDYRAKDKVEWLCSDCHEKADAKHG